ncbi:tetratricopeptide repeat protein [Polyangium sp. 15x6]|uniref:tetratricopeptide repeat protein n=1 Tax=Polyangium sp. 15x6 TaxID=3042687 RepID=UPI00249C9F8E|nr:tetratricopeptide repeat protein [Polyangium sp. 15x6]MDI3291235.1 tetratricopeptide repeat protein [Polyangium sp. 15x6]
MLEDADSVAANLSGGTMLAAKLEAEMRRGMKMHIGYVLVGQRSTTLGRVSRAELTGDCRRVTHFIARASLGAYAVVANSSARMGAAAEIFARGAGASSSSSFFKSTTAGEKAACLSATSEDSAPPGKCRAPVKLLLAAISDTIMAESGEPPLEEHRPLRCPARMVRSSDGACVRTRPGAPQMCVMSDHADCARQCAAGDARSCATLGFMYESGKGVAVDGGQAFRYYQQACDAGALDGCVGLAFLYSKGRGVHPDPARAANMFRDACERGHARACSGIGQQARIEGNGADAIRFFERSCKLGYARACFYAGSALATEGKEPERALRNHEAACVGQDERGCLAMAGMMLSGLGAAPDAMKANHVQGKALNALNQSCASGDGEACEVIGDFYDGRYGKKVRKPEKALEFYQKACRGGRGDACRAAGVMLENGCCAQQDVDR